MRLLVACAASLIAAAALGAQVAATVQVTVRGQGAAPGASGLAVTAGVPMPVAGATVAVLRGLPPGRHTLVISALGFEQATLEVHAANGRIARESVVLDLSAVPLAGLRVRVAPRDGAAGATVVETASLPPGVTDLAAALERVPGATVVRRGPGAPATVQLRGAGGDQVLVLLDGTPLNSPLTGVADLSSVDLESVARIAVIPGAQSATYGPRALGGVVLLESRTAEARGGVVTAGAGAWASTESGILASGGLGDDWSISGGARWRRSDGAFTYDVPAFRGGGRRARENAAFRQTGGDLHLERRGRLEASLRAHVDDVERGSPGTVAQPSLSGRQHHRRWGLEGRAEYGRNALGTAARTAVQWQRAEYADASPPFGRAYDTRTRVRRAEFALEGWWRPETLSLAAGLQGARLDVESNALTSPTVQIDEFAGWARAGRGWEVAGAAQLEVGAAVRVDRHDLVEDVTLSPGVDLSVARSGLALDLTWRRGFSPPGLGDLFFQEGVLVEPNPDLRPERVGGEVAVSLTQRWSLGSVAGEFGGTAYRADLDDMILWFPDHRFVWSPDNYDVLRRGLELGAAAEFGAFGGTHSITADAAWSEVEYTGEVLAGQVVYRPRFTADLALVIGLPAGVSFAPSATHVGGRRTVPGSALNALGAYTLFDAGIAIPLTFGRLAGRLDFVLTNLFDESAALLVDYPLPGRGWSTRLRIGAAR